MNIHKNARLTVHGRERIVRQAMSGQTPKAVALAAGVCLRTIRKWVSRYRTEGLAGLQEGAKRGGRHSGCVGNGLELRRDNDCSLRGLLGSDGMAGRAHLVGIHTPDLRVAGGVLGIRGASRAD